MEAIKPMNLYDLTAELQEIEQALIESGGDITPEMEERWESLKELHADKIVGYVRMIRKFEVSEKAIKEEADRLAKAAKAMGNSAQSLKNRLAAGMAALGLDMHETPIGKVRLQSASRRPLELLTEDLDAFPERFKVVKELVDKTALGKALEDGDEEAAKLARYGEASQFIRIY